MTLTATLAASSLPANVRVVGAAEQPSVLSLTPPAPVAVPGGTVTFTVTLDIPAPAGGASVGLALAPANAGTVPATVTVPANQISATFDYVDGSTVASATVTATLGASMASATITLQALPGTGLVINEIDYDNVGTDTAEFVELYNAGAAPIALAGFELAFVNGANSTVYTTVDLSSAGTIMPGQYLVVGATSVVSTVPAGTLTIDAGAVSNYIQNGAPDGMALVNTNNETLVDALSYEGAMTMAIITGFPGPVNLVEGTVLPTSVADSNTAPGSLCRFPNGSRTRTTPRRTGASARRRRRARRTCRSPSPRRGARQRAAIWWLTRTPPRGVRAGMLETSKLIPVPVNPPLPPAGGVSRTFTSMVTMAPRAYCPESGPVIAEAALQARCSRPPSRRRSTSSACTRRRHRSGSRCT